MHTYHIKQTAVTPLVGHSPRVDANGWSTAVTFIL